MVTCIPSLLKYQGNIHTVCSGHYRRLGEEGLIIVLCLFSTNSLLNLDIRNTVGNWDLDIYVDQQTEEIPGVLQKRMWSLVLLGDKGRRSSCPQQIQPGSRYRQPCDPALPGQCQAWCLPLLMRKIVFMELHKGALRPWTPQPYHSCEKWFSPHWSNVWCPHSRKGYLSFVKISWGEHVFFLN